MSYSFRKNLVSSSKYSLKCPYSMRAEEICVHNTANDAGASGEIKYMIGNSSSTGYHYAVDDKEVVQGIPENRNAFAAGDGRYGRGNRKALHVEICFSKSGGSRYYEAEKNAAHFIASLLYVRGWGVSKVKKHQDYSGKWCPHRILDEGRWNQFKAMIQNELDKMQGKAPSQVIAGVTSSATYVKSYLSVGDRGDDVKTLQKNLLELGYDLDGFGADGIFGDATDNAVRDFQEDYGLVVDGKFGTSSKAAMEKALEDKERVGVVKELQKGLNAKYGTNVPVNGSYTNSTKKALVIGLQTELNKQFNAGLVVDGIWGAKTKNACVNVAQGARGNLTYILQGALYCHKYDPNGLDGIFGAGCTNAVKAFQRAQGLGVDGIAGANTFARLLG